MGRSYKNPPVIEALCEFFFEGGKWDTTIPGLFYEKAKKEYPQKRVITHTELKVDLSSAGEAIQTRRVPEARTQFIRPDGSALVQIAHNLLVFNQLKPYPKFEAWKPKALEAFSVYKELCQPEKISKIGIRYINQILIPYGTFPMEDYFLLYPKLPVTISEVHERFSMSLEIPIQENHLTIVTFGTASPEEPGCHKLVLDIYDVIQSPIPFDKAEYLIIQSHDNIEKTFENSITAKLRDLFGEVK